MTARLFALGLSLLLTACSLGPRYQRPDVDVPTTFRGQYNAGDPRSVAELQWWDVYRDETLQQLIKVALEQNRDLKLAAARVLEARANASIAGVAQLPQVGVGGAGTRQRVTTVGAIPVPGSPIRNDYQATIDVGYEVDLWGRLSSLSEAARAKLLASEFAQEGVRTTLIGDVAANYFTLLALDQQLRISERTVATRERFLKMTQARFDRGVAPGLDVDRAQASLAGARAVVPDLRRQVAQTENQLQILLGQNPGPIVHPRLDLETMPIPPEIPAGLPSALLERRPDLRQAEQDVIAANAQLRSTRAALFPTIALTGSFGSESAALSNLFIGPARIWLFGLSILQPIIDANRNGYQVDAAAAREQQTIILYDQTVAQAFREVSDSLIAHTEYRLQQKQQEIQVAAYGEVARRTLRRYESGYSSYFEVVDADRDLFTAQLLLVQAYRNDLISLIQLYRALGGGWNGAVPDESAAAAPAKPASANNTQN